VNIMSYILDALKKADRERQRGTLPNLDTRQAGPNGRPEKRSRWPYWLAAALLINAGLLLWWLRPWQATAPLSAEQTAATALPAIPAATASQSDPAPPVTEAIAGPVHAAAPPPPFAGERQEITPNTVSGLADPAAGAPAPVGAPPARSIASPAAPPQMSQPAPPPAPQPPLPPQPETAAALTPPASPPEAITEEIIDEETEEQQPLPEGEELADNGFQQPQNPSSAEEMEELPPDSPAAIPDLPSREELPATIQEGVPEITISLHVYSRRSAGRMISIGGRVLREGEMVSPELKLEEITETGAIFGYQGHRFRQLVF